MHAQESSRAGAVIGDIRTPVSLNKFTAKPPTSLEPALPKKAASLDAMPALDAIRPFSSRAARGVRSAGLVTAGRPYARLDLAAVPTRQRAVRVSPASTSATTRKAGRQCRHRQCRIATSSSKTDVAAAAHRSESGSVATRRDQTLCSRTTRGTGGFSTTATRRPVAHEALRSCPKPKLQHVCSHAVPTADRSASQRMGKV